MGGQGGWAESQSLSWATGCNEQPGQIAPPAIRVWVIRAEHLLANRQRALEELPRLRKVALGLEQEGEIAEVSCRIGMIGAEHLLVNPKRALVERPRPPKVALGLEQEGEVIEARRR